MGPKSPVLRPNQHPMSYTSKLLMSESFSMRKILRKTLSSLDCAVRGRERQWMRSVSLFAMPLAFEAKTC